MSGRSCLGHDLEEVLSAFHLWVCCQLWPVIYGLYYFELWSLTSTLLIVFIINEYWIVSKSFSASTEIIIWFFCLQMWCITLIDSWIMNHPCMPRVNSTWWLCMTLLMYYWSQFANILLRNLYPCSSVILACNFHFLCYFCLVLVPTW